MLRLLFVSPLLLLFLSCNSTFVPAFDGLQPVSYRYASLLRVQQSDSLYVCDVMNPWQEGRLLHRYILIPREAPLPANLPEGTIVRTPLQRVVAGSSVHGSLVCELGALAQLVGLCDVAYTKHPELLKAVSAGHLRDMGAAHCPDKEQLVASNPDALLVSPFENAGYGELERLGVPLIEGADYMECSPLARAEWIRFYGMLFGCEASADSLFREVEKTYLQLCERVASMQRQPRVLVDHMQGGVWYVPGGNSTIGKLLQDAGTSYCFSYLPERGSVTLSFETIFAKARDADVWIIRYGAPDDLTYAQLAVDYPPYTSIRAWQERHIWVCNVSHTPFFEETPFHPERLLADIIRIVHPGVMLPEVSTGLTYFSPMQ